MAIIKKGKKTEKPGYPASFVALADKAATMQVAKEYFASQYDEARDSIVEYLASDDCEVTVNVGEKGSNPKIDDLCTVIVSQPERLDNTAATAKVVELLGAGKINVADLVELISTINKEALSKLVDAPTLQSMIKKDGEGEVPLQVSLRVVAGFKDELAKHLEAKVLPVVANRKENNNE